jgi:transaldolase
MTALHCQTRSKLQLKEFKPTDATTNPSLVNAAARLPEYKHILEDAIASVKKSGLSGQEQMNLLLDKVCVPPEQPLFIMFDAPWYYVCSCAWASGARS